MIKVLLCTTFISVAISGALLFLNPISGYEISIYEGTPAFVWIALIYCMACGIGLIFYFIWTSEKISFLYWVLSVTIIILARFELLYVPYMRGYVTLRGDNISHVGAVVDILNSGFIGDNSYPVTHILGSGISLLSSMPPIIFLNYMTALFSVFYVFSIYLLLKTTSVLGKAQCLAFAVAGGVLFDQYNVYVMPNGWSLFFLPFILYVALQTAKCKEYSILFALLLVISVFFHPLTYLLLIAVLVFCSVFYYIKNNFTILKKFSDVSYQFLIPIVLSGILFAWHVLSFQQFVPNIGLLWDSITSAGGGKIPLAQMGDTLSKINFDVYDFIKLFLKMDGDEIIYLIFLFFALLLVLRSYIKGNLKICSNEVIFLGVPILLGAIYGAYQLNLVPGLASIGSGRILSFVMILTPLSTAFVLNHYISERNKIMSLIFVVLILIASTVSILSLYPSPYLFRANPGVTNMDMDEMRWVIANTEGEYEYVTILSPVTRFSDAILGMIETKIEIGKQVPAVVDHFGYNSNISLKQYYNKTVCFPVTYMDQIIYTSVQSYAAVGRFKQHDFIRLNEDKSVDRLYQNGESFVYIINGAL
ncbi:hypothetical protein J2128_001025 [Methanomicrobium sp. W14]|uniref:hypothetical protein n=1 Tax=Methanomicrobium sp. W14 TaxID=2817839 RepID=UPI001AE52455|nr:hypothetical protein [Methanomicrobium sp. W14]MBP2133104.1 hypothetical protein [Methanomicrobium sp. W14]